MPPQIEKTMPVDETQGIEQSLSSDDKKNIFNIRKYLLILLFIQWIVFVITLGVGIYSILIEKTTDILSGFESLIPVIVLTIYYTFGLLVAYQQNQIGLYIFGSIGVILSIGVFIVIGYIFLAIIALDIGFGNGSGSYEFFVFLGILFVIVMIVAITTIKFSFNLAKSINRNEYSTV